jgi:hypothetical protein
MKLTMIAISAAALIVSAPAVFAQGVSSNTPGHEMQERGSTKGSPGASGYAPGQEMQAKGSKKGELARCAAWSSPTSRQPKKDPRLTHEGTDLRFQKLKHELKLILIV